MNCCIAHDWPVTVLDVFKPLSPPTRLSFSSNMRRWITVRDRTRTVCPFVATTEDQRPGEETHENGIGLPLPSVAAAKVQHP